MTRKNKVDDLLTRFERKPTNQKKCPYCQGNEPLVNFDDTPIQIYIGFNEDSALSVDVDSAIYNLTFEIQAIYCPICGRRLLSENS